MSALLGSDSDWIAFGGLHHVSSDLEAAKDDDQASSSDSFDFNIISFNAGIGYRYWEAQFGATRMVR